MLKPQPSVVQNVTVFRGGTFKEAMKLKMRPLEWALIQSDCCLYEKRKFEHAQ